MPSKKPTRHKDDTFTVHALGIRLDKETMIALVNEVSHFAPVTYNEIQNANAEGKRKEAAAKAKSHRKWKAGITIQKFEKAERQRNAGKDIPAPTQEEITAYNAANRIVHGHRVAQERAANAANAANDRARLRG